jgi:hypothetical protein
VFLSFRFPHKNPVSRFFLPHMLQWLKFTKNTSRLENHSPGIRIRNLLNVYLKACHFSNHSDFTLCQNNSCLVQNAYFSLSEGRVIFQGKGTPVSTIKAYGEIYIASLIRDFGARRRFRPQPLYSRTKIPSVSTEQVTGWAPEPVSTLGKKIITFCHQSNDEYTLFQLVTYTFCRVRPPGLPSTT